MTHFELFPEFIVEIKDDQGVLDNLKKTYSHFECSEKNPNVSVGLITGEPKSVCRLGASTENYGITRDSELILKRYGNRMIVSEDWTKIRTTEGMSTTYLKAIIEGKLREHAAAENYAMIHSSAVSKGGEAILFPAWRHTGKTNSMLTMIERDYNYLADDRVLVSDTGSVLGFPTTVHVMPYNIKTFPNLQAGYSSVIRSKIYNSINKTVNDKKSNIYKGIDLVNQAIVANRMKIDIEDIYECDKVDRSNIKKVCFLITSSEKGVKSDEVTQETFSSALSSINEFEWNSLISEMSHVHSSFTDKKVDPVNIEKIVKSDKNVFESLHNNVSSNMVKVPDEDESWSEKNKTSIYNMATSRK